MASREQRTANLCHSCYLIRILSGRSSRLDLKMAQDNPNMILGLFDHKLKLEQG